MHSRIISVGILFFTVCFISCDKKQEPQSNPASADTSKPEDNRFIPVVLTAEAALDEPMMFQVTKDGSVYIIERKGGFKKFDPATNTVKLIATIPVYTHYEQG